MPTNYHDDESVENMLKRGEITALITECDAVEYIIAGDFNCNVGSRCYGHLEEFMADNRVACSGVEMLSGEFTYSNSDHTCVSWIDHVLCTKLIDNNIIEVKVLYDYVLSDHKPLSVIFVSILGVSCRSQTETDASQFFHQCWSDIDGSVLAQYCDYLDFLLYDVEIPRELQVCLSSGSRCVECGHRDSLNLYYRQVMMCIEHAVNAYIPSKKSVNTAYHVPGWNDYVHDKHSEARSAYRDWIYNGRPRTNYLFQCMQRT